MRRFWQFVEAVAWVWTLALLLAAIICVTRPHEGHRGAPHWQAAAILLFVALGLDIVASLARATHEAIGRPTTATKSGGR